MLKNLIVLLTLTILVSSARANIVCEKNGRFWYPKNANAVKITKMLGVKTCNGKRFKAVIAKLGMKSNVVTNSKMSMADVIKAMSK